MLILRGGSDLVTSTFGKKDVKFLTWRYDPDLFYRPARARGLKQENGVAKFAVSQFRSSVSCRKPCKSKRTKAPPRACLDCATGGCSPAGSFFPAPPLNGETLSVVSCLVLLFTPRRERGAGKRRIRHLTLAPVLRVWNSPTRSFVSPSGDLVLRGPWGAHDGILAPASFCPRGCQLLGEKARLSVCFLLGTVSVLGATQFISFFFIRRSVLCLEDRYYLDSFET